MKIIKIDYLLELQNFYNDHLEVFVTLDDDVCTNKFSYWFEVTTPSIFISLYRRT